LDPLAAVTADALASASKIAIAGTMSAQSVARQAEYDT
jgi:hypothetical protein